MKWFMFMLSNDVNIHEKLKNLIIIYNSKFEYDDELIKTITSIKFNI